MLLFSYLLTHEFSPSWACTLAPWPPHIRFARFAQISCWRYKTRHFADADLAFLWQNILTTFLITVDSHCELIVSTIVLLTPWTLALRCHLEKHSWLLIGKIVFIISGRLNERRVVMRLNDVLLTGTDIAHAGSWVPLEYLIHARLNNLLIMIINTTLTLPTATPVALFKVYLLCLTVDILVIQIFYFWVEYSRANLGYGVEIPALTSPECTLPAHASLAKLLAILWLLHEVLQVESNFGAGCTVGKGIDLELPGQVPLIILHYLIVNFEILKSINVITIAFAIA